MTASAVHEVNRLQRQIDALERENEHLKEVTREQADTIAGWARVADGERRLGDGPIGWRSGVALSKITGLSLDEGGHKRPKR